MSFCLDTHSSLCAVLCCVVLLWQLRGISTHGARMRVASVSDTASLTSLFLCSSCVFIYHVLSILLLSALLIVGLPAGLSIDMNAIESAPTRVLDGGIGAEQVVGVACGESHMV